MKVSELKKNLHYFAQFSILGSVKPNKITQILLSNGPEHLYTIQNENPKLQPNPLARIEQPTLPTLLGLNVNLSSVRRGRVSDWADGFGCNFGFSFSMV